MTDVSESAQAAITRAYRWRLASWLSRVVPRSNEEADEIHETIKNLER